MYLFTDFQKNSQGAQTILIQRMVHSTTLISANLKLQDVLSHILLQNEGDLPVQRDHVVRVTGGGQSPALKQGI